LVLVIMLRSEGTLFAVAIGMVGFAAAIVVRSLRWAATASGALLAVGLATAVERLWRSSLLGHLISMPAAPASSSGSVLDDRLTALVTTTLRVSYQNVRADRLLIAALGALAVAAYSLRRDGNERVVTLAVSAAAACYLVWACLAADSAVPGLLVAFPLLWFGLLAGRWSGASLTRSLSLIAAVFTAGVAATQYRQGGGIEWGARYVAVVLPLVVPLALVGLEQARGRLPRSAASRMVAALVVITGALVYVGGMAQRSANEFAGILEDRIARVAPSSRVGQGDQDRRPVVVSAEFVIPQITWSVYDGRRWLRLRDDEPVAVKGPDPRIAALVDAGVDRFTFVTTDLARDRPLLGHEVDIGPDLGLGGWEIVVVEPKPNVGS
jgi:hypothetical protein